MYEIMTTRPIRVSVSAKRLPSGEYLRRGDVVKFKWGGICKGVQRTTTGTIIKLMSDGSFKVRRDGGRLNANGDISKLV